MQLDEAIKFLQPALAPAVRPAHWCDLGCGPGLFTHALASQLLSGSQIDAVDKQNRFDEGQARANVLIRFTQANFIQAHLPFAALDGILMANALHYVKDPSAFIEKARRWQAPHGVWIIIEYETTRANPWVPYPINFAFLTQLFRRAGYQDIQKVAERTSLYNSGRMYCAAVRSV